MTSSVINKKLENDEKLQIYKKILENKLEMYSDFKRENKLKIF